jgi:hypothetical protein
MKTIITPPLKVARFAKLDAGELFLFEHDSTRCVGLVAEYRDPDPERLLLALGPKFPGNLTGPSLIGTLPVTTISFVKEFNIRLPVHPKYWTDVEPDIDCYCLVLSESNLYFRANSHTLPGQPFIRCFVNAASGIVEVNQYRPGEFARPMGTLAFAVSWEIVTTELEPRTILKYPF